MSNVPSDYTVKRVYNHLAGLNGGRGYAGNATDLGDLLDLGADTIRKVIHAIRNGHLTARGQLIKADVPYTKDNGYCLFGKIGDLVEWHSGDAQHRDTRAETFRQAHSTASVREGFNMPFGVNSAPDPRKALLVSVSGSNAA